MANPLLSTRPLYEEDEEQPADPGLLSRIGSASLSGLAKVGNLLDLPFSGIRDVLAGQNPFDQYLNPRKWFTDEGRTSGRELLRTHGLIGQEDTTANWWGGLGAELLLDPLTYTGIGALTKTGKAAQAAGKLTKGLGPSIAKGERALLSVGLPGREATTFFGTGKTAETLGSAVDTGVKLAAESAPGRLATGLFDSTMMGQFSKLGQEVAQQMHPALKAAKERSDEIMAKFVHPIREARETFDAAVGEDAAKWVAHPDSAAAQATAGSQPTFYRVETPGGTAFDPNSPHTGNYWFDNLAQAEDFKTKMAPGGTVYSAAADQTDLKGMVGDSNLAGAFIMPASLRTKMKPHAPGIQPTLTTPANTAAETLAKSPKLREDQMHHVFEQLMRLEADTGMPMDDALRAYDLDPSKLPDEWKTGVSNALDEMQKLATAKFQKVLDNGGHGQMFPEEEGMRHFASTGMRTGTDTAEAARVFQTFFGAMKHRDDVTRMLPRSIVNLIATDPLVRAADDADAGRALVHIVQRYGDYLGKGKKWDDAAQDFVPQWSGVGEHAEAIMGWAKGRKLEGIYRKPVIEDFADHIAKLERADASMDVTHSLAQKYMGPIVSYALNKGAKTADEIKAEVAHVLERVAKEGPTADLKGIPTEGLTDVKKVRLTDFYGMAHMNVDRSLKALAKRMGATTDEQAEVIASALKDSDIGVPHDVAKAVEATTKFTTDKGWQSKLGEIVDMATRPFMRSVTLPFLSFAGRNLGSGQYVNMSSGLMPTLSHMNRYRQQVMASLEMIRTGKMDKQLEKELIKENVFKPSVLYEGVDAGPYADYGSLLPGNPLDVKRTWAEAAKSVAETPPLSESIGEFVGEGLAGRAEQLAGRLPKAAGIRTTYETVLGTGAKVNQHVEFLNRVSMYQYLRKEGWTPKAAAEKVKELQVDYSAANFSPFENQVLRGRLVPFYAFQRKIAPVVLANLAQRPGGAMGQTIRAARLATSDDPTNPDYVQETLSIANPFKTPTDGTKSFLTGFGLPFEELSQFVGPPRTAAREVLSRANPLLKYPLEMATGQTLFQSGAGGYGRALEDLDPPIGRTLSNVAGRFAEGFEKPVRLPTWFEHLAANSPASRFITTARQISDPRKSALDLLLANTTGVRVTDVSPAAQDAILRDRAVEVMKDLGAKSFARTYFSKEELAAMSPEEREQAEKLQALQTALATRAKKRRKAKELAAAK